MLDPIIPPSDQLPDEQPRPTDATDTPAPTADAADVAPVDADASAKPKSRRRKAADTPAPDADAGAKPKSRRRKAADNPALDAGASPEPKSRRGKAAPAKATEAPAPSADADASLKPKSRRRKAAEPAAEATEAAAPAVTAEAPAAEAETSEKPKSRRKTTAKKTARVEEPTTPEPALEVSRSTPPTPAPDAEPSAATLQAELGEQVEAMVDRIRERSPEYTPPPLTRRGLIEIGQRSLGRLVPVATLRRMANSVGAQDLLNTDTWKGMWYMLNYTAQYQRDLIQRRLRGEYTTDEYGYDPEFQEIFKPLLDFLYSRYWRVTTFDVTNVPDEGPAFLLANHSGILPWDAAMIGLAVQRESGSGRMVRGLYAGWLPNIPFLSLLLTKMGMLAAQPDNVRRLLSEGELVLGFPEEQRGVTKLFKDRYRLGRFVRRDMIQAAIETGAPLIPVTVVGSEEIYPVLAQSEGLGKMLGLPAFPITPLWPWTGLLGAVPLPSKWTITFDEPIQTASYGAEAASNATIVTQLADEVRAKIEGRLYDRLKDRKSVFFG